MNLSCYQSLPSDFYQGRDDGLGNERIFQRIQVIDLETATISPQQQKTFALLGFACDLGVSRNKGRAGAKQGPHAIRKSLENLAVHNLKDAVLLDVGDIICENDDLETAQKQLASIVAGLHRNNIKPIVLGGGHETAWGHYQGIFQTHPKEKLAIINFDAHFDMRPLLNNQQGSSGTSFLQIAEQRKAANLNFDYLCLGIQKDANTDALFKTAKDYQVDYVLASDIDKESTGLLLENFISQAEKIYLTYCLDVMAQSVAPAVSAPQALGLLPQQTLPYLKFILASGKVVSFDIVELAPNYDVDGKTAKLAASLVNFTLASWSI